MQVHFERGIAVQNHLLEVDAKKAAGPTWETVRYMVSEIQYGGRITDDFDQLLMDTYAEKYFHQEVTRPGFELYKDERAGISYKIPDSGEIEGFRKVGTAKTAKQTLPSALVSLICMSMKATLLNLLLLPSVCLIHVLDYLSNIRFRSGCMTGM